MQRTDSDFLRRATIVGSIVCLAVSVAVRAHQEHPANRERGDESRSIVARLDRDIPELMKEARVPGLAVALIQQGSVVWQKAFGAKSADTGTPLDLNTEFEAASLGKPVFAYGVMKLVEEKELDLDTPLANYLSYPDLEDERAGKITARMVLSHRTGMPNWRGNKPLQIYFTPGERFSYSGEGFVYLQRVVEHITNKSVNEWMSETVFAPLGMHSSSYVWEEGFEERTALPHNPSGAVAQKRRPPKANVASSLETTVGDYARFVTAVLNGEGLKNETWREMLRPQGQVDASCVVCVTKPVGQTSGSLAWGLGWGLEKTAAGKAIWHWGDNDNFKAFVMAYPERGTGVVYFTNSFNGLALRDKLVGDAQPGEHPAFTWAKYDQFDSRKVRIQSALERTFAEQGTEQGVRLCNELKRKNPEEFKDESLLSNVGFALMSRKKVAEATTVFELNAKAFPNSWMVYDSLGLIYMVQGQKQQAIQNYKRSLELNPGNKRAQDTIKMLESQPGK